MAAVWQVPPLLASMLQAASRPVPAPISGYMLVDTGASVTCIALDVAHKLGLRPVRIQKTYGAGGLHDNEVFEAQLSVMFHDEKGQTVSVTFMQEVAGIAELDKALAGLDVVKNDDLDLRLIGLLGRDFLRDATLVYDGPTGNVEVRIEDRRIRSRGTAV